MTDAFLYTLIVQTPDEARDQLEFLQSKLDCCLVIDGESLQVRIRALSKCRMTHSSL